MTAYQELLRHPRWQRKRLEILNRDNFTCQACGNNESILHVHHIEYIKGRKPWDYPDDMLIALCESCHSEEETLKKTANNKFKELSSFALFPMRRMWQISFAMSFLFKHDKERFNAIKKSINEGLEMNINKFDQFWKDYGEQAD